MATMDDVCLSSPPQCRGKGKGGLGEEGGSRRGEARLVVVRSLRSQFGGIEACEEEEGGNPRERGFQFSHVLNVREGEARSRRGDEF